MGYQDMNSSVDYFMVRWRGRIDNGTQVNAQRNSCITPARCPLLHIATSINRPKDLSGCPAAHVEFSFTAFLALILFWQFSS